MQDESCCVCGKFLGQRRSVFSGRRYEVFCGRRCIKRWQQREEEAHLLIDQIKVAEERVGGDFQPYFAGMLGVGDVFHTSTDVRFINHKYEVVSISPTEIGCLQIDPPEKKLNFVVSQGTVAVDPTIHLIIDRFRRIKRLHPSVQ